MEQIKRLIEAWDFAVSPEARSALPQHIFDNIAVCGTTNVLRALRAALPELRELVEPSRVGKNSRDSLGPVGIRVGDVVTANGGGLGAWLVVGRLAGTARWELRCLSPGHYWGIDGPTDAKVGDMTDFSPSESVDILATGVPLDAKTWPIPDASPAKGREE